MANVTGGGSSCSTNIRGVPKGDRSPSRPPNDGGAMKPKNIKIRINDDYLEASTEVDVDGRGASIECPYPWLSWTPTKLRKLAAWCELAAKWLEEPHDAK